MGGFIFFIGTLALLIILIIISNKICDRTKEENRSIFKYMAAGTLISIYLSWGVVYLAHLNPAVSPTVSSEKVEH